jgi:hypothetical protein
VPLHPGSQERITEYLESAGHAHLAATPLFRSVRNLFALERAFPGRELPHSDGCYPRAILVTLVQLAVTLATTRLWIRNFGDLSLFSAFTLERTLP